MEVIVIVIVIVEVEVEVEVYHRGALAMRKQAYNLFFRYQTTQVIVMLKVYVKVPMCSPVWPCWCFSAPMLQRRTQTRQAVVLVACSKRAWVAAATAAARSAMGPVALHLECPVPAS
jgi:hypothetical protein